MKMRYLAVLIVAFMLLETGSASFETELKLHSSWRKMRSMAKISHVSCTLPIDVPVDHFSVTIKSPTIILDITTWSLDHYSTEALTSTSMMFQSKRTMYPPRIVLNFHVMHMETNFDMSGTCLWSILPARLLTTTPTGRASVNPGGEVKIPTVSVMNPCENLGMLGFPFPDAESPPLHRSGPASPSDFPWGHDGPGGGLGTRDIPRTKRQLPTSPLDLNYEDAIRTSLLFFSAQRSGSIPMSRKLTPTSWVVSSGLNHITAGGRDLTGGWYNGNDAVKLNFPMASAVTVLASGYLYWPDAYENIWEEMENTLIWAADYFLKCWDEKSQILYVQVGDLTEDRKLWVGRNAEVYETLMNDKKWPIYNVSAKNPGSDVAAEMAAALATMSLALTRQEYGGSLLTAAEQIYDFAKNNPGIYSDNIPMANTDYPTYRSSGYKDEMCVAALALYQATYDKKYLEDAMASFDDPDVPEFFSWDNKYLTCAIQLFLKSADKKYSAFVEIFLLNWLDSDYSLEGLAHNSDEGTLRYTANAVYVGLLAVNFNVISDALMKNRIHEWSVKQINYMLGINREGRSYLIGYGNYYPINPYHKISACGASESCGWNFYNSAKNNTELLRGALVGGPDIMDYHVDNRQNKLGNSVALDYNAGFQSALAALQVLKTSLTRQCQSISGFSTSDYWTGSTFSSTPYTTTDATTTEPPTTTTSSTTQTTPTTKYTTRRFPTLMPPAPTTFQYTEALSKSILFYDAQRGGSLPSTNRIPWREYSMTRVRQYVGWYDDDSSVRTTMVMASATTLLGWGAIKFKSGYDISGETEHFLETVRVSLDHLLEAYVVYESGDSFLIRKIGDEEKIRAFWSRPNDNTGIESYRVLELHPQENIRVGGVDIIAEVSAALSIGSVLYKDKDPAYSAQLKETAAKVYEFSRLFNGAFNDTSSLYYSNAGDANDESCLAAMWLYKATQKFEYLTQAQKYLVKHENHLSWDNKHVLCQILLYETTGKSIYRDGISAFLRYWVEREVTYTPDGLAWHGEQGPLRYSANAAFVALLAADVGITPTKLRSWAKSQIDYMLGKNHMAFSYQIGYGDRFPQRPHHRGSSCPKYMKICDWSIYNHPGPNPHQLTGALVGGPDVRDFYEDARSNYTMSRVAVDYNAGFQSVLAGLSDIYQTTTTETVNLQTTKAQTAYHLTKSTTTRKPITQKPSLKPKIEKPPKPPVTAKTTNQPTTKTPTTTPNKASRMKPRATTVKPFESDATDINTSVQMHCNIVVMFISFLLCILVHRS